MARQFTRRHWGREVFGALERTTGMFQGDSGKLSALRAILFLMLIWFLRRFPAATEWSEWNTKFAALLILALIFDQLASRIPMAEMLDAIRGVSLSLAAKGMATIGSVVTSVSKEKETVTTTSVNGAEVVVGPALQTEVEP